jgi:hypothetical protein
MSNELVKHYIAGGVYAKEWLAEGVGEAIQQHTHNYDHLSYLAVGQVEVVVDGEHPTIYTGPTGINIKAGKAHRVTALTSDVVWLCIHAIPSDLRDTEMIEKTLISD